MKTLARVRSQRRFTLSELLVAYAVITFVMAALPVKLQSGQESYLRGSRQIEAQQNVRLAIDRVVDELRDAGFCPTCANSGVTAFAAITNTSTTGFTIQNDWSGNWDGSAGISTSGTVNYVVVNADGTTTTTQRGEQIIYAVTGGALTRREIGNAATGTAIRQVLITMTTQPAVQGQGTLQGKVLVTMIDTVRLRNRTN